MKRLLLPTLIIAVLHIQTLMAVPQQKRMLEVRGRLIDIRLATVGGEAFPQYKHHQFNTSLPEECIGMHYAVSLKEFEGPREVRAKVPCRLLIALCGTTPDPSVWTPTGESFTINQNHYMLYEAYYTTPTEWMPLPSAGKAGPSTMLFAPRLRVADTAPIPGTVIAKIRKLRQGYVTNPSLLLCQDGSYLAACTNINRRRGTEIYRSTDRGKSWELWSEGYYPINFFTLFEFNNRIYMLGTWAKVGHVILCESTDGGRTFSFPENEFDRGVLFRGKYHSAPVPIIIHEGRLWRSMEHNNNQHRRCAGIISAAVDSDLMKASSWIMSNTLSSDKSWPTKCGGGEFTQWVEGGLVKTREGGLVDVMRVNERRIGRTAAIITVQNPQQITFDPTRDIIEMPGGGKKFTIRYDPISDRYWALVNPADPESMKLRHGGIYANGLHAGITRNTLTLISSKDLREWHEERVIITSDNPFFDGFQYVDWQFDGEDIVAVIRLAMEESRGLPNRQHDANFFVFNRILNFRTGNGFTYQINTLHK